MRCTPAVVLATMCASNVLAGPLFAIGGFDPFNPSRLYRIDSDTGAATLIGNTGIAELIGLSWDSAGNRLLAYSASSDLYHVSTLSGQATLIGSGSSTLAEGDLAFAHDGTLLASTVGAFGSVDATGAYSHIASVGLPLDLSGIAFDGAGRLLGYASQGALDDELYSIDSVTGSATMLGLTGTNGMSVGGMDFDADTGVMYLTDGDALHMIDLTTGQATLIGSHGFGGMSGIAVVPAPGVLIALSLMSFRRPRRA